MTSMPHLHIINKIKSKQVDLNGEKVMDGSDVHNHREDLYKNKAIVPQVGDGRRLLGKYPLQPFKKSFCLMCVCVCGWFVRVCKVQWIQLCDYIEPVRALGRRFTRAPPPLCYNMTSTFSSAFIVNRNAQHLQQHKQSQAGSFPTVVANFVHRHFCNLKFAGLQGPRVAWGLKRLPALPAGICIAGLDCVFV